MEPVVEKWKAFRWHTFEIDGHDMKQILNAVTKAKKIKDQPVMIIAHTVKGKGVSFMEGNNAFHGVAPTAEQVEKAIKELS